MLHNKNIYHKSANKPSPLPPDIWDEQTRLAEKRGGKFVETYEIWNSYNYSGASSLGNKMRLAHIFQPKTKAEWEQKYYASGEEYNRQIEKVQKDPHISDKKKQVMIEEMSVLYGRTFDSMREIAKDFCHDCNDNGIAVSKKEALNFVYIHTIDEGWIGYQREKAAERDIADFCKHHGFTYEEASTDTDMNYGVDYEIFDRKGELICGVQVKGLKYRELQRSDSDFAWVNRETAVRNILYEETTGVPVVYAFVDKHFQVTSQYRKAAILQNRNEFALDDYVQSAIKEHHIREKAIKKTEEKITENTHKYENLEKKYKPNYDIEY